MRLRSVALAALLAAATAAPAWAAPAPKPAPGDFRALDAANTLVIDTSQGRIIVELYPVVAPETVARVIQLARAHFYDGLTFFRVVDGFMDQTGDPLNSGQGGSSLPNVKGEFTFRHDPGQVPNVAQVPGGALGFVGALPIATQPDALAAMTVDGKVEAYPLFCTGVFGFARTDAPDSGNSQFFLMRGDQISLSRRYAALGRVIDGESAVQAVKVGEPPPDPQDKMTSVQVLADIPAALRPNLQVIDTGGAYFKALVGRARKGDDFNPCKLPIQTTKG